MHSEVLNVTHNAVTESEASKPRRGRPRITPEEKNTRRSLRRRIAKLKESGELPIRRKQLEAELAARTEPKPRTLREYFKRIDRPLAPRGLHRPGDHAYHNELNALMASSYSRIEGEIYDLNPHLDFRAVSFAMEKLTARVHHFLRVPSDEGEFIRWGAQYAILWASRYQRWFDAIMDRQFIKSVAAGVQDWMGIGKSDELSPDVHHRDTVLVTADGIASDARIWLFSHMNETGEERGTATLFTRVRNWARYQAMAATSERTANAKKHVPWESLVEDEEGEQTQVEISPEQIDPAYWEMLAGDAYALDYA